MHKNKKIILFISILLIYPVMVVIAQQIKPVINQSPQGLPNQTPPQQQFDTQISPNPQIEIPLAKNPFSPSKSQMTVTTPQITITFNNGTSSINASDVQIFDDYDIQSATVNHHQLKIAIKNIQTKNTSISLDGSLNSISTVDNVNYDAFQKIMLASKSMQCSATNEPRNITEAKNLAQMNQLLPQVVTNGTKIEIDQNYTSTQGSIINNIKISYPANAPLPKTSDELLNHLAGSVYIKMAIPIFDGYMNQLIQANASVASVQLAPQNQPNSQAISINAGALFVNFIRSTLDTFIKQGYIIKDNNSYIFFLTFENGVIRINGKAVDLSNGADTTNFVPAGASQSLPAP